MNHWHTLFTHVNLATMTDKGQSYGAIEDGALAIKDGKIAWLGTMDELADQSYQADGVINADGKWLTPGLIDCHTHLVFGGHRANEFEMRLNGASYEEVAAAGGGIVSTVAATRQASEQQLFEGALARLQTLHNEGVTSCEVKSGYGLDLENELKMLRVAGELANALPVTIRRTFLGAHAVPKEYKDNSDAYIELVCEQMLPQVANEGLADAVDVFCESVGFSLEQTERVFTKAKALGIPVKIHAEQLSNLGGSALAAKYQGLSSDHVEYLDEAGVKAMAESDMTAVVLPGAFYFLRETQLPPIELLRKHDVAIAVASDVNPGSSPICSIQLMLNMACTLFRLTPVEALAGVTCHAAKALGLSERVGQLKVGMAADLALWDINQPAQLCYQFGVNPLAELYKNGEQVI